MAKKQPSKKDSQPKQDNVIKDLEDLCIEIFAHAENDYEVTLSGNGTNAFEVSNVASAILDILHVDGRKWRRDNEKRISKRAAELCKE